MRNFNTVLEQIYSPVDTSRIAATLKRLARHDLSRLALTGGIAIEIQLVRLGAEPGRRAAHDIDFIAEAFEDIPATLATSLLVRHVHPLDPPSRNLLQAVDAVTAMRIDIFRAYGEQWGRTIPVELAGVPLHLVAMEDMLARHARLCWDLVEGKPVAPKFARDLERMLDVLYPADFYDAEAIWQEHRKPHMPVHFQAVAAQLRRTIRQRPELLVDPVYSTDPQAQCGRCQPLPAFPLADAGEVMSILGYC